MYKRQDEERNKAKIQAAENEAYDEYSRLYHSGQKEECGYKDGTGGRPIVGKAKEQKRWIKKVV